MATKAIQPSRCMACGMRLSFVNLAANLALAALKALVGTMAGSRALVAAALYSINDVLSAFIVMVSLRASRRPPDEDHAYGHGKVEFVAIGVVSLVLAAGVFFILYFSLIDIVRGQVDAPHGVALIVAALALASNWLLSQRGFCAARYLDSPALHSAAEHNRADAISSLAVFVGVGSAYLGLHIMDRLVAVFEALHILWLGGTLFGRSLKGLMDTAVDPAEVARIRRACRRVEGVLGVEAVRTRLSGAEVLADVVVTVPATLTVEQAHAVTKRVRRAAIRALPRTVRAHVAFRPAEASACATAGPRMGESHA